ncbi:MAG: magnesium transporter, partial [Myxococcota bacterium]
MLRRAFAAPPPGNAMMPEDPTRILVETIQKLQRRGHLRNLRNILDKSHPTDIAIVLRHIPEPTEQLKLFNEVEDLDKRAEILSELSPILLPSFLEVISDEALVPLLEAMAGDDTADILEFLPEERKATLLRQMSREEMTEAQDLLQYDPETAGGIMVPNFFALSEELTCDLAIQALRDVHDELEMVFYAYVTNAHGHLVGVLSLREVVTAPPDTPLRDVMETEVTR